MNYQRHYDLLIERSKALKDRWSNPFDRAALLNRPSQQGRVFSEEHRNRIAKSRIGKVSWNKGLKTGIPAHNKGTSPSEETRQKMRESSERRWNAYRATK